MKCNVIQQQITWVGTATLFALFLLIPFSTYAANLEVTFEQTPLFNSSSLAPGDSVVKTVTVKNNGTVTESVYVSVANETSTGLADVIQLTIVASSTGTTYFDNSFSTFFSSVPVALGTLSAVDSEIFIFTATFQDSADDTYQATTMGFDLIVGFEGGESESDNGGGGGSGGGGGNDDDDDDTSTTTPTGVTAGEDTTNPFQTSFGDVVRGLVLGETIAAEEHGPEETPTDTSPNNVASVAGASVDFLDGIDCTLLLFIALILLSLSWSFIDDYLRGNVLPFLRNLGFSVVYLLAVFSFAALGDLETFWWVFLLFWAAFVAGDYVYHMYIVEGWNPRYRNVYFAVGAAIFLLLALFTSLLCAWLPFAIILLVSIILFFFHDKP